MMMIKEFSSVRSDPFLAQGGNPGKRIKNQLAPAK